MRLRDIGEFGLIARIERAARRAGSPTWVRIGIGDDAAVVRPRRGEDVVLSTDALVEDVHFRRSNESARSIGRRALVANLSDLAAMGARPLGFTCALAAPPELAVSTLDGIVAGLLIEAGKHRCPLLGGNVSAARELSLTLAVLGGVGRGRALTRSGARAGDDLFVTGVLGAAALARARAERSGRPMRHVPQPRLAAGRALTRIRAVRACIDLSDGLLADAAHLLGPAGLAADIDPDAVPRPARFSAACARVGLDPVRTLMTGGEDYELLFVVRGARPTAAELARRLRVPVSRVGRVVSAGSLAEPADAGGWRHF